MKKLLLLFLVLATSLPSLFAQKSVQVNDSTFFNELPGDSLSLSEWTRYFYNSNCLDSISQHLYLFKSFDTTQQINDYYPNNNLYHTISQSWDTASHSYLNLRRYTYYYNTANKSSTATTEQWTNNSWQPANLSTDSYNSNGKLDTSLFQYWNGTLQTYINQSENVYTYDSYGNETSNLSQSWNADSSSWQPYSDYTYLYNASGFLLDFSFSEVDYFTNMYGLSEHDSYYPDSLNRIDSSYQTDYEYGDSTRTYYTYYPSSGKTSQVITYNYQITGASSGNNISLYYYDSTGNVFNDSIVTKNFTSTPDSAVVSSTTLSEQTRGTNGIQLYYQSTFVDSYGDTSTTEESYNEYGQLTHFMETYINAKGVLESGREDRYHYILCPSAVLPVTLLSFTGQQQNKDALLQWQTSNEINTAYFNLQRSTDGVHFITIHKTMASGNSSTVRNYAYTDANINLLNSTKIYYRLAETDNNGTTTYSKTIAITVTNGRLSIAIAPNPVQNTIYLYSPVSVTNAQVTVIGMNGVLLYSSRQNMVAGVPLGIDASRFAKGMYLITVQSQTDKQVFKLVK